MMLEYVLGGLAAVVAGVLLLAWLLRFMGDRPLHPTYRDTVLSVLGFLATMATILMLVLGFVAFVYGIASVAAWVGSL